MGIEGAAGETGGQHDVVDVGAGMAAQAEQPGGMVEDFGAGAGLAGGAGGHSDLKICHSTYHMLSDISCIQAVDCAALVAASRSARLKTSTKADGGWAPETAYFRFTMKQGTPLMPRRRA